MGYYIEVPAAKGKAAQLAKMYDAIIMDDPPPTFDDIPESLALICVVDNGPFEAAALCHSAEEFAAFSAPDDVEPSTMKDRDGFTEFHMRPKQQRPRTWLLMDQGEAHKLAGFTG